MNTFMASWQQQIVSHLQTRSAFRKPQLCIHEYLKKQISAAEIND